MADLESACWVCEAEETTFFELPLQVGSHPCALQSVPLCRTCASDLAVILDEWRDDMLLAQRRKKGG